MTTPRRGEVERLLLSYPVFRKTYRNDRVAFVQDCIRWNEGEKPAFYQDDILGSMDVHERVAAYGPRGLGKTAIAAWATLHWALSFDGDDWKSVQTASVWRQLDKFLWPEIHKWAGRLDWRKVGRVEFDGQRELMKHGLKLATGEAFPVASKPENAATIEGAHADRLFYLFDESKIIVPVIWNAIEGAFASPGDRRVLAVSTPGDINTRFHDICTRKPGYEEWHVRHVTLDECLRAGRVSPEWVEKRARQWTTESALYQNQVLGLFCSAQETGVVPLAWVEQAIERWYERQDRAQREAVIAVGADIARFGDDQSVTALRRESNFIDPLRYSSMASTMETAGRLVGILRAHPEATCYVDVIGIGAGVVDRLREQGLTVRAFNAGEHTDMRDASGELEFVNLRAASWWHAREMLDPTSVANVALPDDPLLIGDLTAPKWATASSGKIIVEAKEAIKLRLGRSTDSGDAVVMALWDGMGQPSTETAVVQGEAEYVVEDWR